MHFKIYAMFSRVCTPDKTIHFLKELQTFSKELKAGVHVNRSEIWSIIKRELLGLKWVGNTTRQLIDHLKWEPQVGMGVVTFGIRLLILHSKFRFSKSIKSSIFFNIFFNLTYPLRKISLSQNDQKSPKDLHKTTKQWLMTEYYGAFSTSTSKISGPDTCSQLILIQVITMKKSKKLSEQNAPPSLQSLCRVPPSLVHPHEEAPMRSCCNSFIFKAESLICSLVGAFLLLSRGVLVPSLFRSSAVVNFHFSGVFPTYFNPNNSLLIILKISLLFRYTPALTRPFCQYLGRISSDAKSLWLFH